MDVYEIIASLSLMLGASLCSGINLYATVAVLGLMHRYTGFDLPEGMDVLGSHWVIWPALLLYSVEFVADKIPAVDTAWDTIQTFIRVPAGAALAAMSLGDVPTEVQVLAFMLGGGVALAAHGVKATTRVVAHSTGTSPVLSPVLSVAEDGLVVGTMTLVAAYPIIALAFIGVLLVALYFIITTFWKVARKVFGALFGRRSPQLEVAA